MNGAVIVSLRPALKERRARRAFGFNVSVQGQTPKREGEREPEQWVSKSQWGEKWAPLLPPKKWVRTHMCAVRAPLSERARAVVAQSRQLIVKECLVMYACFRGGFFFVGWWFSPGHWNVATVELVAFRWCFFSIMPRKYFLATEGVPVRFLPDIFN